MINYNIVILNWNGWHDTINCIESLLKFSTKRNFTIYLVDNGSEPTEIEKIEEYLFSNFQEPIIGFQEDFLQLKIKVARKINDPIKIVFIKNNENLGFAKGNNVALKYLKAIGENKVILLNNDTEIIDDTLNKMVSFYDNQSNVGAVVPQIRYFEPNNIIWNCGGMINKIGVRKYDYAFANIENVPDKGFKRIDYGTGCCILFDVQKVGVLIERFFFGEEDMEFAFRLRKMGLPIFCLYDSILYHKVGASRDQISKNAIGKMVYHYCQRISNLKSNLSSFLFYVSLIAHMLSSIRLLKSMKALNFSTFRNSWKVILKNVNKEQFTLNDFKFISNQNY